MNDDSLSLQPLLITPAMVAQARANEAQLARTQAQAADETSAGSEQTEQLKVSFVLDPRSL